MRGYRVPPARQPIRTEPLSGFEDNFNIGRIRTIWIRKKVSKRATEFLLETQFKLGCFEMDRIIMIKITFYGFLLVNRPPFHYSSFDNCSSFSGHPFVLSLNVDGWSIASLFSRSFLFLFIRV